MEQSILRVGIPDGAECSEGGDTCAHLAAVYGRVEEVWGGGGQMEFWWQAFKRMFAAK